MIIKRRRFKQSQSLQERLIEEAQRLRSMANELPWGGARMAALKKARQAEVAMHMSEWLTSPGLRTPE